MEINNEKIIAKLTKRYRLQKEKEMVVEKAMVESLKKTRQNHGKHRYLLSC